MTRPRIFADFQNADAQGRVRLNCVGTSEDLQRLDIELRRGLEVILYSDELEVAGTTTFNDDERLWVAVINWDAIRDTEMYRFLELRPRSNYRQLWIKDRRIRAEILYRMTVGPEPRTPEEVAADFDVPVEAVREAVDYCQRNKDLLDAERAREEESIRRMGLDQPPYVPSLETKDA